MSSNSIYRKVILEYADTEDEAFEKAEPYWAQGAKNVTVAKVSQMTNPPETVHKYVVLRITKV